MGQSRGAKGKGEARGSGISQKEQKEVLAAFREGKFNVMVATCIGEEGLDICQVCDWTYCCHLTSPGEKTS